MFIFFKQSTAAPVHFFLDTITFTGLDDSGSTHVLDHPPILDQKSNAHRSPRLCTTRIGFVGPKLRKEKGKPITFYAFTHACPPSKSLPQNTEVDVKNPLSATESSIPCSLELTSGNTTPFFFFIISYVQRNAERPQLQRRKKTQRAWRTGSAPIVVILVSCPHRSILSNPGIRNTKAPVPQFALPCSLSGIDRAIEDPKYGVDVVHLL